MGVGDLALDVKAFVHAMCGLTHSPASVWLIGSQANGRATTESDWDLLIFGSSSLIEELKRDVHTPLNIEALVVYNGNDYSDPWQNKRGSLKNLKWRLESATVASYEGVRWVPCSESEEDYSSSSGNILILKEKALRLWAAPAIQQTTHCPQDFN